MIGNCPKCKEAIRVPAGEPDQDVRCPLCNSEYQLQDVFDRLPPLLELVGGSAASGNESVGIQIDDGFSDLEVQHAGTQSKNPSNYSRPRRAERSAFKEILKVIGGGVVAIPIGILCVWWFAGRDPFDLSEKVSEYAPWIVPEKLRAGDQVDDSDFDAIRNEKNSEVESGKQNEPKPVNSDLFFPESKSNEGAKPNEPGKNVERDPQKNPVASKESVSKKSAADQSKATQPATAIKPKPPSPESAGKQEKGDEPVKPAPSKSEDEKSIKEGDEETPLGIAENDRKKVVTWLMSLPWLRIGIGPIVFSKEPSPAMEIELKQAEDFDLAGWVAKGKQEPATEPVLLKILDSNDASIEMERVLFAIGWTGTERSVPVLLKCLNRGDAEFLHNVLSVLCEIPDKRAVQQLGSRLQIAAAGQFGLAPRLIVALKEIGTEESLGFVVEAMDSPDEAIVEIATEEYERTTPLPKRSTEFEFGGFF